MSAADRLEDSFPHGTPDGWARGCRGGGCPAGEEHGLSCRRAKQLAAGDYRYQKLVRRGLAPFEIALEMGLHPEAHTVAVKKRAAVPVDEYDDVDDVAEEPEEPVMEKQTTPANFVKFVKPGKPEPTPDDAKQRRAEIRAWAAANGIHVGEKGRIAQAVVIGWLNDDPTLGGTRPPEPPATPEAPADAGAVPDEPSEAHTTEEDTPAEPAPVAVVHVATVPDMETRARLFNEGFTEAEKQAEISVAIAESERDRAHAVLAFTLEQLGNERRRREAAETRARTAAAELAALNMMTTADMAIIADLDQRIAELTRENNRMRAPWWKRRAS